MEIVKTKLECIQIPSRMGEYMKSGDVHRKWRVNRGQSLLNCYSLAAKNKALGIITTSTVLYHGPQILAAQSWLKISSTVEKGSSASPDIGRTFEIIPGIGRKRNPRGCKLWWYGGIIGNENGTSYESGMWDLSKKRNIMSTHKTHVSSQTDIKGRAEESDFFVAWKILDIWR